MFIHSNLTFNAQNGSHSELVRWFEHRQASFGLRKKVNAKNCKYNTVESAGLFTMNNNHKKILFAPKMAISVHLFQIGASAGQLGP